MVITYHDVFDAIMGIAGRRTPTDKRTLEWLVAHNLATATRVDIANGGYRLDEKLTTVGRRVYYDTIKALSDQLHRLNETGQLTPRKTEQDGKENQDHSSNHQEDGYIWVANTPEKTEGNNCPVIDTFGAHDSRRGHKLET